MARPFISQTERSPVADIFPNVPSSPSTFSQFVLSWLVLLAPFDRFGFSRSNFPERLSQDLSRFVDSNGAGFQSHHGRLAILGMNWSCFHIIDFSIMLLLTFVLHCWCCHLEVFAEMQGLDFGWFVHAYREARRRFYLVIDLDLVIAARRKPFTFFLIMLFQLRLLSQHQLLMSFHPGKLLA